MDVVFASSVWGQAAWVGGVALVLWAVRRLAYGRRGRGDERVEAAEAANGDAGSVYVLTNPDYPDLVKVGHTARSAAERAEELSSDTAVPRSFEVAYEVAVDDAEGVERAVHARLAAERVNPDREFFEVTVDRAVETIRRVAGRRGERGLLRRTLGPAAARALGLGVVALGAVVAGAVLTHHPGDAAALEAAGGWGDLLPTRGAGEPVRNALGLAGAAVAHALVERFVGGGSLLVAGLALVWGEAVFRRWSLRRLVVPTVLALVVTGLATGLVGWAGHAVASEAPTWAGPAPEPAYARWAGAVGVATAEWLQRAVGPSGTPAVLALSLAAAVALAARWVRR
jgi:hypothetical protein